MSGPALEWRYLYPSETSPGRKTLFVDGTAVGDYYQATGDVFRVRCWPPYRLQGGQERLVLTVTAAEQTLLEIVKSSWRTRRDEEDGA